MGLCVGHGHLPTEGMTDHHARLAHHRGELRQICSARLKGVRSIRALAVAMVAEVHQHRLPRGVCSNEPPSEELVAVMMGALDHAEPALAKLEQYVAELDAESTAT